MHPVTTARYFLAAWPAMREIVAERPLPSTSLHRLVGPDRTLALIRSSLEPIKQMAHASNATVNDVLLTVTAGGLRRLLNSRGEPVEQVLRIYVPVSLHREPRSSTGKPDRADGRPASDRNLRSGPEARADR